VDERFKATALELDGKPDAELEFARRLARLKAATVATAQV